MPLLLCPNDNAAMQTVSRSDVQFDICPTCRGVWLDRGELEKLMSAAADTGGAERRDGRPPEPRYEAPRQEASRYERRHDDDRRWDDRRWDDDGYRKKKRRGFDIFDIFD